MAEPSIQTQGPDEPAGEEASTTPVRPEPRRYAASLVIATAVALALGVMLRQPTLMAANDISRWCTVWSLLERGSYVIDECPWQLQTQDKVYLAIPAAGGGAKHFYSSKPALLSTAIAAILYPARKLTGVPIDRVVVQEREERWTQVADPAALGQVKGVKEKPGEPVKWSAHILYFKPALVLLNILPFGCFLVLFARVLDRYAADDWSWFYGLTAAAFGTYLLPFTQTLNNHTIAAFSAFFALYQFLRIWDEWELSGWRFAGVGFFAGLVAANELPALTFLALIFWLLLFRFPRKTLLCALPAALIPAAAFLGAQYAVFGEVRLAYEEFGKEAYLYEGSLWKSPLELDALDVPWREPEEAVRRGIAKESYGLYLFHETFGHHGFWSLSPIFLVSLAGLRRLLRGGGLFLTIWTWLTWLAIAGLGGYFVYDPAAWDVGGQLHDYRWSLLAIPGLIGLLSLLGWIQLLVRRGGGQPMAAVAWMTLVLTGVTLAFYTWTPKARNYGGSTQGLRWLFWLIPFWLLLLIKGTEGGRAGRWSRTCATVALAVSVLSVGYAMRNPWSHPWILDGLEHLGFYTLPR